MSDLDALTIAVLAVALTPFAYWELGHRRGMSWPGSPPWIRRAFVWAWLAAMFVPVLHIEGVV